jgi:hypothetical protein
MNILPFGRRLVISLVVLLALPLLPLTLTMIPFEEMLNRLIRIAI